MLFIYAISQGSKSLITFLHRLDTIWTNILTGQEANTELDEQLVLREVELRLLRHSIIPADREAAHALGWYLGIDILIVGSAYHVKVGFHRRVTYDVGDRTFGKEGITWQIWYTGVHEDDSGIFIDSLLESMDDFANEFLESSNE